MCEAPARATGRGFFRVRAGQQPYKGRRRERSDVFADEDRTILQLEGFGCLREEPLIIGIGHRSLHASAIGGPIGECHRCDQLAGVLTGVAKAEPRAAPTTLCDAANPLNTRVVSRFEYNNFKMWAACTSPGSSPRLP